jgi:hypothetical protein
MSTAVAAAGRSQRRAVLGAVTWEPRAELDLAEWVDHGRKLGGASRSCGWWIGDWLRYGNERFGERYTRASKATGYDIQTLMNMVYVASHVDVLGAITPSLPRCRSRNSRGGSPAPKSTNGRSATCASKSATPAMRSAAATSLNIP